MSIKTGPQEWPLLPGVRTLFQAEGEFSVFKSDGQGNPVEFVGRSTDGLFRVRSAYPGDVVPLLIKVPAGMHWAVHEGPEPYDRADPVPMEAPIDALAEVPLLEKLKKFIREAVEERYGEDSDEVETFEESVDFGPEDADPLPLSGFEVNEMVEEAPVEPPPGEVTSSEPAASQGGPEGAGELGESPGGQPGATSTEGSPVPEGASPPKGENPA